MAMAPCTDSGASEPCKGASRPVLGPRTSGTPEVRGCGSSAPTMGWQTSGVPLSHRCSQPGSREPSRRLRDARNCCSRPCLSWGLGDWGSPSLTSSGEMVAVPAPGRAREGIFGEGLREGRGVRLSAGPGCEGEDRQTSKQELRPWADPDSETAPSPFP